MENEEKWNIFTQTGKVQDYLAYAGMQEKVASEAKNAVREMRTSNRVGDERRYGGNTD